MPSERPAHVFAAALAALIALATAPVAAHRLGEDSPERVVAQATSPAGAAAAAPGVSGQGALRFEILRGRDFLPAEAQAVLKDAHGGFAVDRRPGKGEVYFALPGAGIVRVSADLERAEMLPTPDKVKSANMHNTTIWYGPNDEAFLTFPGNGTANVLTTTLDGRLVSELGPPGAADAFDEAAVNEYFGKGGAFVPTDVEWVDGTLFVTTGYSALDYVLTAGIGADATNPKWGKLAFGGKGSEPGKFGTGHGITVKPGPNRDLAVADRPQSQIESFSTGGRFLHSLDLPKGSLPCDVDYEAGYTIVGCLDGPDKTKGAPVYILKGGALLSTVVPKDDLGLELFTHIHNAAARDIGGRLYLFVQAWNPGDFAILRQVD